MLSALRNYLGRAAPLLAPHAALLVLNVVFRLPHFINAAGVNSDTAIVGLQAMHILNGEVDRLLWGADYQSSFDAIVVAGFFAVFGPTPLALMAAPFAGHLLLCALAFDLLRRRCSSPWVAFVLCLPLVFTPQAINAVVLYAPRQWSITTLFLGLWLFEGGQLRRPLRFFLGGMFVWLSIFLDLYALQIAVPLTGFMLACAFDAPRQAKDVALRLGFGSVGALFGYGLVQWLRAVPGATAQATTIVFDLARVKANATLLWDTCLPWVLGAKVWASGTHADSYLWEVPLPVRIFQMLGACTLVVAIVTAPLQLLNRGLAWPLKRMGLLGAAAALVSISGFLISSMPWDLWAARYLAPIVWFAPFAFAPWAGRLRAGSLLALLAPYLITAALGGFKSHGPYVDGWVPRIVARGSAEEEMKLAEVLRSKGVEAAYAQYWLSYRLTFLWHEWPIVMPLYENRYSKYGEQTAGAKTVAYIFHPSEPRAVAENVLPGLVGGTVERLTIAGFDTVIHHR